LFDITLITDPAGALMAQGPQVLGAAADTDVTLKSGGTATMAAQGMVSLTAEDEAEALGLTARLLDLLPGCNLEDAPILDSDDMNRMLPEWDGEDVRALAGLVADRGTEIELHQAFDATMLTFLCRMGGRPAGLIVCNAKGGEGLTTASGARKAARFVRMCDCFNLPVITLIDTQGMEVTAVDSQGDILNAAAQLFYAYAEATCPKAAVIIGDAVGQGYLAMCGQTAADTTYAWPGAVISALTPEAAVQTLYANEINEGGNDASLTRKALAEAYAKETASAFFAARNGYIDDVIDPAATRQYLIAAIEMLASKRESSTPKKHGNLPL
jgi:acetyl-CoA carboxylase carboxyltransferase component